MVLDQNKNLKVVIASTINTSVFLLHIVIIAYIDTAVFFEAQNHRRHPQSQQLLSNEDTRRIIKKKKERNKAANNMIIIVAALRILLSYLHRRFMCAQSIFYALIAWSISFVTWFRLLGYENVWPHLLYLLHLWLILNGGNRSARETRAYQGSILVEMVVTHRMINSFIVSNIQIFSVIPICYL